MAFKASRLGSFRTFAFATIASVSAASCASDFDTSRGVDSVKTTLGEDLYSGICDRVGASSLREDLTGASYRTICHKTEKGWVGVKVKSSLLPPVSGKAAEYRELAIAKIETMARYRADLIAAFDAIVPDTKVPDPLAPKDESKQVRLYDAVDIFAKRLTPLYDVIPGPNSAPSMPAMTQSMGRLMQVLIDSPEAQKALSQISDRGGYRPAATSLGAMRPLMAYPKLRKLVQVLLKKLGPGGSIEPQMQRVIEVMQQELKTYKADPPLSVLKVDDGKLQPNRARSKLEFAMAVMLAEDNDFAGSTPPSYIPLRDMRGWVLPNGAKPGVQGGVPAPFADTDGDGFADVDFMGRFIGADGEPIGAPPPFSTPYLPYAEAFGFDDLTARATNSGKLLYQYVNTSRTFAFSNLRDLNPLVGSQGDGTAPATLMKALEGVRVLAGPRVGATRSYGSSVDKSAPIELSYNAFDADNSPLVDLVHAVGTFVGAPESDDYLAQMVELHQQQPEKTARALALAWSIRAEAKKSKYDKAALKASSVFWDDFAEWLARAARVGADRHTGTNPKPMGLVPDLVQALAHPDAVKYLPKGFGQTFLYKDRLNYNPNDLNGPPISLETNTAFDANAKFQKLVDRTKPDTGENRSAFVRFSQLIHDTKGVRACNKPDTIVDSKMSICGLFNIPLQYPPKIPLIPQGTISECELFQIDDLGVFFLDSLLPKGHPRKAQIKIKDATLSGILNFVKGLPILPKSCTDVLTFDSIFEGSSGIKGLRATNPTPQALARLVYFGAESSAFANNVMTDLDPYVGGKNKDLNTFIKSTMNPVGSVTCPKNGNGVNTCSSFGETLRGKTPGYLFYVEQPFLAKKPAGCTEDCDLPTSGMFEGIKPMILTFANYSVPCASNPQLNCPGETLFVDLIDMLYKHWPEASSAVSTYEELLGWVFEVSDLLPMSGELVPTLRDQKYNSVRVTKGQRSALEITKSLITFLFDQEAAKKLQITTRKGETSIKLANGATKAQVTPFDLFANALNGFDKRFLEFGAEGPDKQVRWKQARSEIVDQFLLAEGGAWKNKAIAKVLPLATRILREQVNANCPDRESSKQCSWGQKQLHQKFAESLGGPLFAVVLDLVEALRQDEEARRELESLLSYLTQQGKDPALAASVLASMVDTMQALQDERNLAPVMSAMSPGMAPRLRFLQGKDKEPNPQAGPLNHTLDLMTVLLEDYPEEAPEKAKEKAIDPYRVLDVLMRNMVTPPSPEQRAPLDTIIDAIVAIHRVDSSIDGAMSPEDYATMGAGLKTFMTDEFRGLEQFYKIVRGRNGE